MEKILQISEVIANLKKNKKISQLVQKQMLEEILTSINESENNLTANNLEIITLLTEILRDRISGSENQK